MMGLVHMVLYAVVVSTLAAAGAQGTLPPSRPQPTDRGIVADGKNPYANIFQTLEASRALEDRTQAKRSPSTTDTQPRVVCGMVVVPVKPSADPKMVVQPKQEPTTEYRIRKIAPQICNE